MAAAHAWDPHAAAAAGMRTAYVPCPDDSFDLYATSIEDLHAKLLAATHDA